MQHIKIIFTTHQTQSTATTLLPTINSHHHITTTSPTTQNPIQNKPIAHQHQIRSPTTTTTSTINLDKPTASTPSRTPTSKPKTFIIQVNLDSKPTIFPPHSPLPPRHSLPSIPQPQNHWQL